VGLAIGALTVVFYRRLREVVVDEKPEAIIDRMTKQLQELEHRITAEA
jgi:hypothetical protein